jgi:cation diffusion facilitator CzcD-associated flavoprotein CzcO
MDRPLPLLVVGAGPFGLALAADAGSRGIDYRIVGKPAEFWASNMPKGMYLRSGADWHLDPLGECTIERFLATRGLDPAGGAPLSRDTYLDYLEWFRAVRGIAPIAEYVRRLDALEGGQGGFRVALDSGRTLDAANVVLALGFRYFRHFPDEITERIPPGRLSHTCDLVDFAPLAGRRCLVVGGRQSAYEWAALLREAGAARVDLVHRQDRPRFAPSDWAWVGPLVDRTAANPGWYRALPPAEREALEARMYAEGRGKLEPWLEARVRADGIRVWPRARVVGCETGYDGALRVALDTGDRLAVDHVVLATGYKADLAKIPFLAAGNLRGRIAARDGYPILNDELETSVPGLFATSFLATQAFGSFFAFTVAARAGAKIVGAAIERRVRRS